MSRSVSERARSTHPGPQIMVGFFVPPPSRLGRLGVQKTPVSASGSITEGGEDGGIRGWVQASAMGARVGRGEIETTEGLDDI